jgi:hypothetical protein
VVELVFCWQKHGPVIFYSVLCKKPAYINFWKYEPMYKRRFFIPLCFLIFDASNEPLFSKKGMLFQTTLAYGKRI